MECTHPSGSKSKFLCRLRALAAALGLLGRQSVTPSAKLEVGRLVRDRYFVTLRQPLSAGMEEELVSERL